MGLIDPLKRGQENVSPSKENPKSSRPKGEKTVDVALSKIPSEDQSSLEKSGSLQPRATVLKEVKARTDLFKDIDPSKKPISAKLFQEERTQENSISETEDAPILSESLQDFKEEEEAELLEEEEEEEEIGSPDEGSTSATPDFSQDSDEERDRELDDEDPKNPLKKKKNKRVL